MNERMNESCLSSVCRDHDLATVSCSKSCRVVELREFGQPMKLELNGRFHNPIISLKLALTYLTYH